MSESTTAQHRPRVIQITIKEKAALYAAYIPAFVDGGIFVPTTREYLLGDDMYLLITLPGEAHRYPVIGKVAWITPAKAVGGRTQGVGISFSRDDSSRLIKSKIEAILDGFLASERPTQTI